MPLKLRALGVGLAFLLSATACSQEGPEPESSEPPPSATPSPTASADPTEADPIDAECAVAGYVATDAKKVTGGQAVAVYASGRGMAPGSTSSGTDVLGLFDLTPMRVTSPLGEVPAEIRRSVTESVGGAWLPRGLPEQSGPHEFSLRNDSSRNQVYVLYRGAELLKGTWSAERCGAPYNDGTEVLKMSGKFSVLTPVRRLRVYDCGVEPADKYERAASRVCRL